MNQIRLTPIVKNILIINVLIWLALMILPRINSQVGQFGSKYFALHKIDLLGINPTVEIEGVTYYIPREAKLSSKAAQELINRNPQLIEKVIGNLQADQFVPVQIILWFFTHFSFLHILFNMIVLISIGPLMENVLGSKRFIAFYLFCGIVGGLMVTLFDPSPSPVIGASGALFGLILAFAMYFPTQQLQLFFFIPITALNLVKWAGIISAAFVVIDFIGVNMGSLGFMGTISHFGHLTGMIAALMFFYIEKYIPFLKD